MKLRPWKALLTLLRCCAVRLPALLCVLQYDRHMPSSSDGLLVETVQGDLPCSAHLQRFQLIIHELRVLNPISDTFLLFSFFRQLSLLLLQPRLRHPWRLDLRGGKQVKVSE